MHLELFQKETLIFIEEVIHLKFVVVVKEEG